MSNGNSAKCMNKLTFIALFLSKKLLKSYNQLSLNYY